MWSFFSKDPSKDLVNYEIQELIQLHPELQEKTIWSINNAKKKNASNPPQINELFSVFSYQVKQGNESWVLIILILVKNVLKFNIDYYNLLSFHQRKMHLKE